MENDLYNLPQYYDIAFSWDPKVEIEAFQGYFEKHVPFEVKNILEPACGSGRFLISFPRYGYRVTGYDNNPKMVAYSRERIERIGLQDSAKAMLGDMAAIRYDDKFDSAICPINSLGYLTSDDQILSHFFNTGDSLKSGGIYIIQINCASDNFEPPETGEVDDDWVFERDGIRIKTRWDIEREDHQKKISHQLCTMDIDDHGRRFVLKDRHKIRLWFFEDLKDLIQRSGRFKLETIYNKRNKLLPSSTRISGELGNLTYILKVI